MVVKLFTDGTIVPTDQENLVRPVKIKKNIMQGGKGIVEEQTLYERVSDHEILETFMRFGGLD